MGNVVVVHEIGRHRVAIANRDGVMLPSPYTLLLAQHLPEMTGWTIVDVGTGSGILAIVARLLGASTAFVNDTNVDAVDLAMENAERNGVLEGMIPLSSTGDMLPLPMGLRVDAVICNPAQLPMPDPEVPDNPHFAGTDGRRMIEGVIGETPRRLHQDGRLFMVHNSMADFPASLALLKSMDFETRVLAQRTLEFRPFFNRSWFDRLGGPARGLYTVVNGRAYETLYVLEARLVTGRTTTV
jgi:methylase of polypeptide subunit release factors